MGVFPVGGRWPDEKSIDIRMRPSLAAFRMHALVKSHLSPKLKQREDLIMKCWIPLTQAEMQRKAIRKTAMGTVAIYIGVEADGRLL